MACFEGLTKAHSVFLCAVVVSVSVCLPQRPLSLYAVVGTVGIVASDVFDECLARDTLPHQPLLARALL